MKIIQLWIIVFLQSVYLNALDLDQKLELVKEVYSLSSKECKPAISKDTSAQFIAGQALFESKVLSGNNDISCINCHLDKFGSADGLPLAAGVLGDKEGKERYFDGKGILVQRNAFSLKGRAHKEFVNYFWDGKAQLQNKKIVSQFGNQLSTKFDSLFAVASILPLIERDEFIGYNNEIEDAIGDKLYRKRYDAIGNVIRNRLIDRNSKDAIELADKLIKAQVNIQTFELADAGNLIAKFFEKKFPCEISAWDRYLEGKKNALTDSQKKGAVLFYGKGRCASCHSGKFFSDFDFHSIGAPQGYFGVHSRHRDIGRAGVTNRTEDLYKFRTPPLTLVKETPPYGHAGAFKTLRSVIVHHFNPYEFYKVNDTYYEADYYSIGKIISSRDSVLNAIDIHSEEEVSQLIDFLKAL